MSSGIPDQSHSVAATGSHALSIHTLRGAEIAALRLNLAQIVAEAARSIPGSRCSIQVFDRPDVLRTVAASGVSTEDLAQSTFRIGEGIAGHVALTHLPMLVPDTAQEPAYRTLGRETHGALLCVPLLDHNACYGTITLRCPQSQGVGSTALAILGLAARAVTLTISRAHETRTLLDLARQAASDDERAAERLPRAIHDRMPQIACVVAVLAEGASAPSVAFVGDSDQSAHAALRAWTLSALDQFRADAGDTGSAIERVGVYAAVALPLRAAGRLMGAVGFFAKEAFAAEDFAILAGCAHLLGLAVAADRSDRPRSADSDLVAAFAQTADGILLLDAEGTTALAANAAFYRLTGIDPTSVALPLPIETLAAFWSPGTPVLADHAAAGVPQWSVVPRVHPDRTLTATESFVTVGEQQRRLHTFHDDTAIARMQRVRSEFMSVVSHELRSPLASMYGYLNILTRETAGPLSPMQRDCLRATHIALRQLWRLIDDINDLIESDRDQITLQIERVDLMEVIRAAVTSMMPILQGNNVRVELEVQAPMPEISLDPVRFHQILTNLITNAMKFSPPEAVIGVHARFVDGAAEIRVRDAGPGVAPEDAERIFERFVKGRHAPQRDASGLGLGLAVVRELVGLHGGRVWVESPSGEGSTFAFTLPAAPPTPAT